jgi:hypothetical protein
VKGVWDERVPEFNSEEFADTVKRRIKFILGFGNNKDAVCINCCWF